MLQDLHSHTYYSFCGADKPEAIVEAAIDGGLELFGITDHNYGIGCARIDTYRSNSADIADNYFNCLDRYRDHINLIKEKYADRIKILTGIEICTLKRGRLPLPESADVSAFDYCLIESIDSGDTVTGGDVFSYAKKLGCICGVAHTDLFAYTERIGVNPYDYFSRMAEQGIFWEMNVNYDRTHNYHEHKYMLDFFESEEQQEIVRRSGVRLSVGFDGHRVNDYLPERVKDYCRRLEDMRIPMQFDNV